MTSEQLAVLAPSQSGGAGLSLSASASLGVDEGIEDVQVERVIENDLSLLNKNLDEPSSNWSGKYSRNKCSTPSRSLYKCPEKRDLPVRIKLNLRCSFVLQLKLGITDVKGPTNFICYWRIFVIANVGDNEK